MRSRLLVTVVEFLLLSLVSCHAQQITGCTDPLANNYDPDATINDGSCTYDPVSVFPQQTYPLSDRLKRTSGLIFWDGSLWTQNDHVDTILYGLDTITAEIKRTYALAEVKNIDWEEISQDRNYIYIGDFGNNLGNRTDLHILRIKKNSLLEGQRVIDTIWFSYSDQTDFSTKEAFQTDFDCEAMIVTNDSIYLFTKQWNSAQTTFYSLPKIPGSYHALKKDSYNVQGLVTGATYIENRQLVVLCGYTTLLQPFLIMLYDFGENDFFSGNKRKLDLSLPLHQIEGIASQNGLKYFISNESFSLQEIIISPQKLHLFDLSPYLAEYLLNGSTMVKSSDLNGTVIIYPNPAYNYINVKIDHELRAASYEIYDKYARMVSSGILCDAISTFDISYLTPGFFTFKIGDSYKHVFSILKVE